MPYILTGETSERGDLEEGLGIVLALDAAHKSKKIEGQENYL